jgi:hypothetical protein
MTTEKWLVTTNRAPDAQQFPLCVRDQDGWSVAYVSGCEGHIPTLEKAQLIAAAPVLLDVAKAVASINLDAATIIVLGERFANFVRGARFAVALATGDNPEARS